MTADTHTARLATLAGTLVLALAMPVSASAQDRAPAVSSAIGECETAARSGADMARALGACDFALRDSSLRTEERARILINRAALSAARGNGAAAITDLDTARAELPDLPELYLNLSAAQIRVGNYDAAEASARRALDLGLEDSHLAYFNRGIALERLDRHEDAYRAYSEAARLAPDNQLIATQPRRYVRHQPSGS
ncbi:MAG: tetratricopeptide repeat protein [Oceanicaulis sp.]|uniref:tetratricopeptide repeat protein n=1 Tax=Glycocaulis sp. TaxID=1969725 RepID=UPI0025B946A2|nr:tetratricopeptide repeat protein [Glycocaulis sp.]MCC5980387.1 tetratricopeptide repeat protein [Oceanicaulis sp.]MCH8520313.1 tetratricopeptide repeat protein [Glycocaulis sp.]